MPKLVFNAATLSPNLATRDLVEASTIIESVVQVLRANGYTVEGDPKVQTGDESLNFYFEAGW